jgi:lysozyme
MTDYVHGIDLNRYRSGVSLKTAKQQGNRFVICKATEGPTWVDPTYKPYQAEAKSINLPFGGYIYWRYIHDAAKQAEHFVDNLGDVQFPPIVDVERYLNVKSGTSATPIHSVVANRNHLKVVLDEIERLSDRRPMIYTNFYTWRSLFANWGLITDYELWVANWRSGHEPYLPSPATEWVLHQYTNKYIVQGYYRGVDGNWFNGNEASFEEQLNLWNPSPPPPPPPEPKQVTVVEVAKSTGSEIFVLQPGEKATITVEEV